MVNASALVTVSHPDHGLFTGMQITVSGAAAVGGITPSGAYTITVLTADSYTFTHGSNATSGATGGGSAVLAQLARIDRNHVDAQRRALRTPLRSGTGSP